MADEEIKHDEQSPPTQRRIWSKLGTLLFCLALLAIAISMIYLEIEQKHRNTSLEQKINDFSLQMAQNNSAINELQQTVTQIQQATEKSQALSQQQEQLVKEWEAAQKGDLLRWQVAEAQYLTKLANDLLQLTGNAQSALALLERADKVLQGQEDAKLFEIRKSLSQAIAELKLLPVMDVTGLYLQLEALNQQINQLPLPHAPLQANNPPPLTTQTTVLPWWQRALDRAWQNLQKIVIVSRTGSGAPPLVLPEEKMFLYQNIHAQLGNAMWAVLHRNAVVFQSSLDKAAQWIQTYFDSASPLTKNMLQSLSALKAMNIEPPKGDLSSTLQYFDEYFRPMQSDQTRQ